VIVADTQAVRCRLCERVAESIVQSKVIWRRLAEGHWSKPTGQRSAWVSFDRASVDSPDAPGVFTLGPSSPRWKIRSRA
jgi:hypothetical protein